MSTITLSGNTISGRLGIGSFMSIGSSFSNALSSTTNLSNELGKLRNKIDAVNTFVNVDGSQVTTAKKREENKSSTLSCAYEKLGALITDVGVVDNKTAIEVEKLKKDFYKKYSYLKPESEKNWWDRVKDRAGQLWNGICDIRNKIHKFFSDVVDWAKEHLGEILTILVVVVATIVLVGVAVASFGGAAVFLVAVVGAAAGVAGQLIKDTITCCLTGEWTSSWTDYVGAALGGAFGGILELFGLGLLGKGISSGLGKGISSGISSLFKSSLKNLTGESNKSILQIWGGALFDAGFSVAMKGLTDKITSFAHLKVDFSKSYYSTTLKSLAENKTGFGDGSFNWYLFILEMGIQEKMVSGLSNNFRDSIITKFGIKDYTKKAVKSIPMLLPGIINMPTVLPRCPHPSIIIKFVLPIKVFNLNLNTLKVA